MLRSLVETLPTLKGNLKSNSQLLQESVDVVKELAEDIIGMVSQNIQVKLLENSNSILEIFLYNF